MEVGAWGGSSPLPLHFKTLPAFLSNLMKAIKKLSEVHESTNDKFIEKLYLPSSWSIKPHRGT